MSHEIYQPHLDRVSRSFAFCIAQLREPLRARVGLSYLLCRVLDTIEDAAWDAKGAQFAAYAEFDRALTSPGGSVRAEWDKDFPPTIPLSERALLKDADLLFEDFHKEPRPARAILKDAIVSMSKGMQHFGRERAPRVAALKLRDVAEVNQYCFFVAGVVGELLARLLALETAEFLADKHNLLGAHHFGQFLQKVNVLKDQVADEKLGRHLVPDRGAVEASANVNVLEAFRFLRRLPSGEREFARFCAWSLFLGLESLGLARDSAQKGTVQKLTRKALTELLAQLEPALDDPAALGAIFATQLGRLGWDLELPSGGVDRTRDLGALDVLFDLYRGKLERKDLAALGL